MTKPEALKIIERVVPEAVIVPWAEQLLESEIRRLSRPVQLHLDFREGLVAHADLLPRPPIYSRDRRRA